MTDTLRAAVAGLVIAALGTGCTILELGPSPFVPGSQWQVVAVDDGQALDGELILTFIGDSATLSSECGASSAEVVMDTDGRTISFGPFQGPAGRPICPEEAQALHQRVADALQGVERWGAAGNHLELGGESVIRLQPQRTDT